MSIQLRTVWGKGRVPKSRPHRCMLCCQTGVCLCVSSLCLLAQIEMKEVDRLAAVVALVDEEGGVVPRGAYLKTPQGVVALNKSFQGTVMGHLCL